MTVSAPEAPEPDDENAKAVINAAERIVSGEAETVQVQEIVGLAMKVGAHLKAWRHLMVSNGGPEGDDDTYGFPEQWVDTAAMTIFHKFFKPVDTYDEDELLERMHEHWEHYHDD
jgi:hypothetical protein